MWFELYVFHCVSFYLNSFLHNFVKFIEGQISLIWSFIFILTATAKCGWWNWCSLSFDSFESSYLTWNTDDLRYSCLTFIKILFSEGLNFCLLVIIIFIRVIFKSTFDSKFPIYWLSKCFKSFFYPTDIFIAASWTSV